MTDPADILRFHPAGALVLVVTGPPSPAAAKVDAPPLSEKQSRRRRMLRSVASLRPAQA